MAICKPCCWTWPTILPPDCIWTAPWLDVPGAGTLEPLRRTLIEHVGQEIEKAFERTRTACESHHLVEVLEFFTSLGWHPSSESGLALWQFWEKLSG